MSHQRRSSITTLLLLLVTALGFPPVSSAYDVEVDSLSNQVFVLLRNLNPTADFLSVSMGDNLPSFVPVATATIIPASVPASGSDLAAVDFDVSASALLGEMGDLTIIVSGIEDGKHVDVRLTVPLEVVATAAAAQGELGVGIPAPDPGGTDTDGDGVTDAHEDAFGSDPLNPNSVPGKLACADVPALRQFALILMLALVLLSGARLARSQRMEGWQ